MIVKRKYYIDILKVVGLLCLILAHVEAPLVLKEIREFDVSLMVFLSGLLVTKDLNIPVRRSRPSGGG